MRWISSKQQWLMCVKMIEPKGRGWQDPPPKPVEPELSECCQRNCEMCVFVYYQKALDRWSKKVAECEAASGRVNIDSDQNK